MPQKMNYKAKIWMVKSSTQKGVEYVIREMPDGEIRCSCPGFVFRGECKHAKKVKKDAMVGKAD